MEYPTERNLDDVFFRVERDGRWLNLCFSDMTSEEREGVCKNRSGEWFKSLAFILADTLRDIGDQLDIVAHDKE